MKCCMESRMGDWMGQVVTFAGEYMGTVVEDGCVLLVGIQSHGVF